MAAAPTPNELVTNADMDQNPSQQPPRRKRRIILWLLGALLAAAAAGYALTTEGRLAMGKPPSGARLARIQRSPQWGGDRFKDVLPRVEPRLWPALKAWLWGGSDHRTPTGLLPIETRLRQDFETSPSSGLRITWFGHSSTLIEIDGQRLLLDPVWGAHAAPFSWLGVSRFYPPPIPLEELPSIDAVVISHDHYDHLDYPTIKALAATAVRFLVPLGVGSHLKHWGIAEDRITELDWWQETMVGPTRLVATPARHFSGRSLTDREQTLWAGWAIIGQQQRVFYSGDTAMFPGFSDIGRRLGPFDATLIESGAYNALWADVHLGPEQAVRAHQMVRGQVMFPVHWGLFNLATHGWTEPMERVLAEAARAQVRVVTPRPGQSVEPATAPPAKRWWPQLPWESSHQAPVVSSGM